jgi:hypothetical protein
VAEATTPKLPSPGLRELIATLIEDGEGLEPQVLTFAVSVCQVEREFSSEIDPLHLDDRRYERLATMCGLERLLKLVHRMETALGEVAER